MKNNQFLLPAELGWECNDELNAYFKKWLKDVQKFGYSGIPADVSIAQLMDNWYAIIKKYQAKVVAPNALAEKDLTSNTLVSPTTHTFTCYPDLTNLTNNTNRGKL